MAKYKKTAKKIWHFLWDDNSIWSWLANIVLAYVLIKFIVYPLIGLLLGTSFPIVAVVSGSMDHHAVQRGALYQICGHTYTEKPKYLGFDQYWNSCGEWYEQNSITKEDFLGYSIHNGFRRGDIIVLTSPKKIKIGDIIVFHSTAKSEPIIHRVINFDGKIVQTKGDNNMDSYDQIDKNIPLNKVVGKASFKIPYLGFVKIFFFEMIEKIGII